MLRQQVLWTSDILAMFIFISSSVGSLSPSSMLTWDILECELSPYWASLRALLQVNFQVDEHLFPACLSTSDVCWTPLWRQDSEHHCGGQQTSALLHEGTTQDHRSEILYLVLLSKSGSCVWFWLLKSGLCVWFWSQSALLVLGCSFFIICVTVVRESSHHIWTVFPPGVLLGVMVGCFSKTLKF